MYVEDLISDYLRVNEYRGLINDELAECSCEMDAGILMHCGEIQGTCRIDTREQVEE